MSWQDLPEIVLDDDGIATVRGWEPSMLSRLLAIYEQELDSGKFRAREHLQPGLPEDEVRSRLAAHGMVPSVELVSWFAWANGSSVALPGIYPAALEQALQNYVDVYVHMRDHPEPGLEGVDWGAGKGWLRLELDNYAKAIDCRPGHTEPVEIHQADPSFGEESKNYGRCRSLSTLVTWWIQGLRNGAYEWLPTNRSWALTHYPSVPELQRASGLA